MNNPTYYISRVYYFHVFEHMYVILHEYHDAPDTRITDNSSVL